MGEDTGEEIREIREMRPDTPERAPERHAERPAERPVTGELRVDAALRALDDLDELPIEAHPALFERVHGQLADVLGELRSAGPQQ